MKLMNGSSPAQLQQNRLPMEPRTGEREGFRDAPAAPSFAAAEQSRAQHQHHNSTIHQQQQQHYAQQQRHHAPPLSNSNQDRQGPAAGAESRSSFGGDDDDALFGDIDFAALTTSADAPRPACTDAPAGAGARADPCLAQRPYQPDDRTRPVPPPFDSRGGSGGVAPTNLPMIGNSASSDVNALRNRLTEIAMEMFMVRIQSDAFNRPNHSIEIMLNCAHLSCRSCVRPPPATSA